jgi:hypothetical protein
VHFNYMIDARHTLAFSLGATHRYGERDLAVLAHQRNHPRRAGQR